MTSAKLPALQFYTGDWLKDPSVQALDHEHKGVWMDLLCMMHESTDRGRLVLPTGQPFPDAGIARFLGLEQAKWKQIRSNLLAYGVASQDEAGVLYNRRMVRDEAIREARRRSGAIGGRASAAKQTSSKPQAKAQANSRSSVSSSVSTTVVTTKENPPTPLRLEERVEVILSKDDGKLSGFVDPLRDYLAERVPPHRQHAYLRTVQGWLDGTANVFRKPDGTRLEPDRIPDVLAEALNDLGASDEEMMKRPVGDPANLRTKIDALLRLRGRRHDRNPGPGNPATASGSQASQPTSSISGYRQSAGA